MVERARAVKGVKPLTLNPINSPEFLMNDKQINRAARGDTGGGGDLADCDCARRLVGANARVSAHVLAQSSDG